MAKITRLIPLILLGVFLSMGVFFGEIRIPFNKYSNQYIVSASMPTCQLRDYFDCLKDFILDSFREKMVTAEQYTFLSEGIEGIESFTTRPTVCHWDFRRALIKAINHLDAFAKECYEVFFFDENNEYEYEYEYTEETYLENVEDEEDEEEFQSRVS